MLVEVAEPLKLPVPERGEKSKVSWSPVSVPRSSRFPKHSVEECPVTVSPTWESVTWISSRERHVLVLKQSDGNVIIPAHAPLRSRGIGVGVT
jgi:hypothetical protein